MIPAAFVPVASLPETNHGKLDRRGLPPPDWTQLAGGRSSGPMSPVESLIAAVWSDELGLPVGPEDNFFSLGGHSLMAARLIARLRTTLHAGITLRHLFERPTLREFAEAVRSLEPPPGRLEEMAALFERIRRMDRAEKQALLDGGQPEEA
jgi:aryl carrier-like protein